MSTKLLSRYHKNLYIKLEGRNLQRRQHLGGCGTSHSHTRRFPFCVLRHQLTWGFPILGELTDLTAMKSEMFSHLHLLNFRKPVSITLVTVSSHQVMSWRLQTDLVTSFQFGSLGIGSGRGDVNVRSVPQLLYVFRDSSWINWPRWYQWVTVSFFQCPLKRADRKSLFNKENAILQRLPSKPSKGPRGGGGTLRYHTSFTCPHWFCRR
jgi:hypothetical protein